MSDLTAADIAAMTRKDGFLEGNGIIILILFFLVFGGGFGGFGFGNAAAQGALTRAELYDGLNVQDVKASLGDLSTQMNNNAMTSMMSMNNQFAGLQQGLCNSFAGVNQNISNLGHQLEMCCCQTKEAVHAEGEATRALINQVNFDYYRTQLDDKNRELLHANLIASQLSQTNNIQNFIRSAMSGCGCGCGYTA